MAVVVVVKGVGVGVREGVSVLMVVTRVGGVVREVVGERGDRGTLCYQA